ncbi:MAG: prepilin-type N-terminal cleavage/methylation domain-containing protein [Bacilli bacterium]|nr:prepilin-type N-terminal cleavage/methylation domain-containing protein [Bacilli bacterium]
MKRGFTLVEVLAVIVIIGVLGVIIIPPVLSSIEKSKKVAYDNLIENIEQTTQLYVRNNKDNIAGITVVGNTVVITLQNLVDAESLGTPVVDPRSKKEISLATTVSILVEPRGKYVVTVGSLIYVGG